MAAAAGGSFFTWLSMRADAKDEKFQAARKEADERATIAVALAKRRAAGRPARDAAKPIRSCAAKRCSRKNCAVCHVLGKWGDPKKASAATLDGWEPKRGFCK